MFGRARPVRRNSCGGGAQAPLPRLMQLRRQRPRFVAHQPPDAFDLRPDAVRRRGDRQRVRRPAEREPRVNSG